MSTTPRLDQQTGLKRTHSQTRRALLLANFKARRVRNALRPGIKQLQASGIEVLVQRAKRPEDLRRLIHLHRSQIDLVIVGGGDGTLNCVVDVLIETDLPLGILPLGTANDLARTLGIPPEVPDACQVIIHGNLRRIDLGWVNGKHYFNVASMGLSVSITRRISRELKRRWGVLAYLITAFRVLRRSRPFRAEICSGDQCWNVKTIQIAIGNGRFYGGGMVVAEDAAIDDQCLDLYSLEVEHWWHVPLLLGRLRYGTLRDVANVRTLRGQEFEIRTRRPRAINTDGEITVRTPAHFRLVPRALAVFAPPVRGAAVTSVLG